MSGEKNAKIWDTVVLIPQQNNLNTTNKSAEHVRRFSYKKNLVFVTVGVACFAIFSLAIFISLLFYSRSTSVSSAKDIALPNSSLNSHSNNDSQRSNVSIGGLYILERLGSDFRGYLKSLKLPRQVADIVLKSAEVVEIVEPESEQEEWKIVTTAGNDRDVVVVTVVAIVSLVVVVVVVVKDSCYYVQLDLQIHFFRLWHP